MRAMYDAIVIGSRCAGAPTAMLLARKGRRVLLVDRSTFPSDTLSGHTIQPAGVARLQRWGLLDRVRATGAPFTPRVRFDFGAVVLEGSPTPIDGVSDMVCVRRTVLDALLADAAAEAGAEVRHGFTVKELLWEDDRVVGIRGRDRAGRVVEERARIVIGADGAGSFVARAVDAATYHEQPAATICTYSYWRGVDLDAAELYVRPNRFVVAVPTNDDLAIVVAAFPIAEADAVRGDAEVAFGRTLATVPHLASRVRAGERVERFRVASLHDSFFRVPAGPGWALVGDAGCHKDPITAQGMADAFRDAELLADAVDDGLSGDLASALRRYQRRRDEAMLPVYEFTCGLAHVEAPPPPEVQQLVAALEGNAADTARFLGLMAGSVRLEDFFHPHNLDRIMKEAA
jgi:2-polyprenyl-6-methoxyphenol hydroxylase-like FAD-dependent oxidoreductase